MKKKLLLLLVLCYFQSEVLSQQDRIFSMYWNNISVYNPAASGVKYKIDAYNISKLQWTKIAGAPRVTQFAYNMKIAKIKSGVGINYTYDYLGFEKNHTVNVNYAYHLELGDDKILGLGVSGGIYSKKFDNPTWITPDATIHSLDSAIPIFPNSYTTKFNLNSGVFYSSKKLDIGLSLIHINQPNFEALYFQSTMNLYGYFSYKLDVGENISLNPNLLIVSDFSSTRINFNALTTFKDVYWIGLGYGNGTKLMLSAGVNLKKKIRIGYSFHGFDNFLGYTHEIVLAFGLE